jgi:hypothetical protein
MHLVMMPVGLFPTRRTRGRADVPPAFTFRRFLSPPPRFIEQEPNQILPAQALSARGSQTSSGAVLLGHDQLDRTSTRCGPTGAGPLRSSFNNKRTKQKKGAALAHSPRQQSASGAFGLLNQLNKTIRNHPTSCSSR